ncbi:MAG: hypothetical protein WCE45_01435 [Sedimentisphaerales bacterium]
MKIGIRISILLAILFCSTFAFADTDFYQDYTIDSGVWTGNNFVHGMAILTVNGGDILSISALDSSTVDVNGGVISTIFLYESENATINLYGGNLTTGFHGRFTIPNAINIYGKDFFITQNGDNAYLSGKWANDSDFNFYFLRSNGLPDIVTLHIIPEPFTILLLALGVAFVPHKRT